MNEKLLQHHILHYYKSRGSNHMDTNFSGHGFQECDVIGITSSGFSIEYEIKVSRADFRADLKKEKKHFRLANPHKKMRKKYWGIPNRFYYVCPLNMISVEEVPEYTGLLYYNPSGKLSQSIDVIKKAPLIHSYKHGEPLINAMCHSLTNKLIYGGSYKKWQEQHCIQHEDESAEPLNEIIDKPGIDGQCFTIKLDKDWFIG